MNYDIVMTIDGFLVKDSIGQVVADLFKTREEAEAYVRQRIVDWFVSKSQMDARFKGMRGSR